MKLCAFILAEGKEENLENQPEKDKMLDKDTEIIAEKDSTLKEKSLDDSESSKTEETLKNDKPDGPETQVEVLTLEPTNSPRKAEEDVGESLEPGKRFFHTIYVQNPAQFAFFCRNLSEALA